MIYIAIFFVILAIPFSVIVDQFHKARRPVPVYCEVVLFICAVGIIASLAGGILYETYIEYHIK